jgi:hypothetical protein
VPKPMPTFEKAAGTRFDKEEEEEVRYEEEEGEAGVNSD